MLSSSRYACSRSGKGSHRIENLCVGFGLPVRMLNFDPEAYWRVMGSDKKVRDSRIRFILPTRLGQVEIRDDIGESELKDCLLGTMEP